MILNGTSIQGILTAWAFGTTPAVQRLWTNAFIECAHSQSLAPLLFSVADECIHREEGEEVESADSSSQRDSLSHDNSSTCYVAFGDSDMPHSRETSDAGMSTEERPKGGRETGTSKELDSRDILISGEMI